MIRLLATIVHVHRRRVDGGTKTGTLHVTQRPSALDPALPSYTIAWFDPARSAQVVTLDLSREQAARLAAALAPAARRGG